MFGSPKPKIAPGRAGDEAFADLALQRESPRVRYGGRPFNAELDATELDDRLRPSGTWTGKGRELSRSVLVLNSRRMVHAGRLVLVAIHLIDDEPVPLFGRVVECEYESEGMHRIVLDLLPLPASDVLHDWIVGRARGA